MAAVIERRPSAAVRVTTWVLHAAVGVVTIWSVWTLSAPRVPFTAALGALAVGFVLLVLWAITAAVARRGRRARWSRLVAPTAGLLLIVLSTTHLPLRARWALAQPEFTRALAAAPAWPADRSDRPWLRQDVGEQLGSYRVLGAQQSRHGVVFSLADSGVVHGATAFAYLPNGTEGLPGLAKSPVNDYVDLGGGWYAVTGDS